MKWSSLGVLRASNPWLDHLKNLTGLLCPYNINVVCVRYGLLGDLAILHGCVTHGTHALVFSNCLWDCAWPACLKSRSCIVLVANPSAMHVHLSCVTQPHIMHSSTSNIVWFCQGNPSFHPMGIPGMVHAVW